MNYEFLEGDIYAVDKQTGELIWDEDIGLRMGSMLLDQLSSIEKHIHNHDDDVIIIDMPVLRWIEDLCCKSINEHTPQEDEVFRFVSELGTRVFSGSDYNGHNAFLRVRIFIQNHIEHRRKAQKMRMELIKNG